MNGLITVFSIGDKFNIWKKIKILKDHNSKVTCIITNDNLNIFVSSCIEGKINLYTIPKLEIYRTIDLNYANNLGKSIIPNALIISSTPLPSISVYCDSHNSMLTYSINGEKLSKHALNDKNAENKSVIISFSEIFRDENFSDKIVTEFF